MASDKPSWWDYSLHLIDLILLHRALEQDITKNPIAQAAVKSVVKDSLTKYSLGATAEDHDDNENDIESPSDKPIEELQISEEELKNIKKFSYMLRIGFMICASLMLVTGFLSLSSSSLGDIFIALYVIFFAILICCFELAFSGISRWIAQNFGFMYTKIGRMLFILFLAFLCFGLGLFGIIVMCLLVLGIIGNFYVMYRCPHYEEWIRVQHFRNMTNK